MQDGRHFSFHPEQFVDCRLSGANRVLNREDNILRNFDELADESKILRIIWNWRRSVAECTRHEHARDVGHSAGNADGGEDRIQIEVEVPAQFLQNFRSIAIRHRLGNEVTDAIGM